MINKSSEFQLFDQNLIKVNLFQFLNCKITQFNFRDQSTNNKGDLNMTTNNKSKLKVENNQIDDNHNSSSRAVNTSSLSSSNSLSTHNRNLTNQPSESNLKKSDKKNSNFFCGRAQPASIASTNSNPTGIKYFNKNTILTKFSTNDVEKSRMPKINKQPSSNGSINSNDDHFSNASQHSKSHGYFGSTHFNGSQNSTSSDYKLLRRSSVESNATSGYHSNDKKSKNYISSRNLPNTKLSDTNYSNKLKSNMNESDYFTSANKLKSRNTLKHCRHSSLDTDDHSAHNPYHQHNHKKRNSVSDDKLLLGCNSSQQHPSIDATSDFSSQIYYESRLKSLEDKIKKHQNDMKTFLNQNPRVRSKTDKTIKPLKVLSESKISKSNVRGDLVRSKSEHNHNEHVAVKYDYTYAEGDLAKCKSTKRGNNFGVITASDLFKLRTTEMIL